MGFYSFVVFTRSELPLDHEQILLEQGVNTFNLVVDDVDNFVAKLTDKGVRVIQQHRLDEFEPIKTFDEHVDGNEPIELRPALEPGLLDHGSASNPLLIAQSGEARLDRGGVPLDLDEPEADRDPS